MAPTKRSKLSPENTVTKSRLWTQEEDDLLKTLVQTYGCERGKLSNWPCIAAHFPKRSIKVCNNYINRVFTLTNYLELSKTLVLYS